MILQCRKVAAALSAAVTTTNQQETASTFQAEPSQQKPPTQTPAALREKGSGEEGKDSHSRQWRLSMAVFLNRNKRPLAAPIEVAELLSEKPPPPQNLPPHQLFAIACSRKSREMHQIPAAPTSV